MRRGYLNLPGTIAAIMAAALPGPTMPFAKGPPDHFMRGSKFRQAVKRTPSIYRPHQGKRECERRRRQLTYEQLDFTSSGQMEIKGRRRGIREAFFAGVRGEA